MDLPCLVKQKLICARHTCHDGHTISLSSTEGLQSIPFAKGLQVICGGKSGRESVGVRRRLQTMPGWLHSIRVALQLPPVGTLLSYIYDILCLQETRLLMAEQQFLTNSTSLHCLWGSPVTGNSRCGVGIVVNATKFAKYLQIVARRIILATLSGPQVVFKLRYFICVTTVPFCCTTCMALPGLGNLRRLSGHAGSRALPANSVGDSNAESEAIIYTQSLLGTPWHDVADMSNGPSFTPAIRARDHASTMFGVRMWRGLFAPASHVKATYSLIKDIASCSVPSLPFASRLHFTPRQACAFGHVVAPEKPLTCTMPVEFHAALRSKDVDTAASI